MSIVVRTWSGELVSLEATLNGARKADIRLWQGDRDLLIDSVDPVSDTHRQRVLARLPEVLKPEAERLLADLAAEAFVRRQSDPDPDGADEERSRWAPPEPWPTAVDGGLLLDGIHRVLREYLILPRAEDYDALALWIVFTHAHDAFEHSPLLIVTSAERGSGKSRVLDLLACLVPKPWAMLSPSDAALFRVIEQHHPTLLLDEADNIEWAKRGELLSLLNGGFKRRGSTIPRCVGEGAAMEVKDFSVWCPKAFASLRLELADTVVSRSIVIRLERKLPTERVARFYATKTEAALDPVRRQTARWVADHETAVQSVDPAMPDTLSDRAADAWTPLVAIADVIGGEWPARARRAASVVSGATAEPQGLGERLLADIRTIFDANPGVGRLPSEELVSRLVTLDESPWGDWGRKGFTVRALSKLLRPFGIAPRTQRFGETTAKGYLREQFEVAWSRYLPAIRHTVTSHAAERFTPNSQASQPRACDGTARTPKSRSDNECDGVTDPESFAQGFERGDAWEPPAPPPPVCPEIPKCPICSTPCRRTVQRMWRCPKCTPDNRWAEASAA